MRKYTVFILASLLFNFSLIAQEGVISGKVIDEESGEPLIGVNVIIEGTTTGSSTGLDGDFRIKVEPGIYNLIATYISYADKKIIGITVKKDEITELNFTMSTASIEINEVVVEAKKVKDSENAMLAMQKNADKIQDGISSEEMSKQGAGNAAESMKKITGATIVDGKYIYVRGLGDRYSNSQLNGQNLPGTDPYRNSTQMDMIPSDLLENIITSKTFTPDQPGNFTGGNVNINTKSFPEEFTLSFSTSLSYNTLSSLKDNFLVSEGGSFDWLGYDDGSRAIPKALKDSSLSGLLTRTAYIRARRNDSIAGIVDKTSNSLNSQMAPSTGRSFLDHGFSFSLGNQVKVFGKPLGFIASVNYNRSYKFYKSGISAAYELAETGAGTLNNSFKFQDTKAVDNPNSGSLFSLNYRLHKNHEVGLNFIYNHDATDVARYQTGSYPAVIANSDNIFETRTLHFTERDLKTFQLQGKHRLADLKGIKAEWSTGYTNSYQHEPDLRFFANDHTGDSLHYISPSEYDLPYHYFRDLNDRQLQSKADITIPVLQGINKSNKLKAGGYFSTKKRIFNEQRYQVHSTTNSVPYAGNADTYFHDENTGIIGYDSVRNYYLIGNYITDESLAANNYSGTENITATFAMGVLGFEGLKIITGARLEHTYIHVQSKDTTNPAGEINQIDILPALNLVYALGEKLNLRGAYTHTLARPNMRELAPFGSFDFIGGYIYLGNPELKQTKVHNYDIRLEWFPDYGELISVSAYYKDFYNPIIKTFTPQAVNPEIRYQNVEHAIVYGVELEVRKSLQFINERLKNVKTGWNISLIHSEVDMDQEEYQILKEINPEIKPARPFQGQSPYIINSFLSYENDSLNMSSTISYNISGPRLSEVSIDGTPDIYEQPRHLLDFIIRKGIMDNFTLKFSVKNLLNAGFKKSVTYNGKNYLYQAYPAGRTFGLGVTYKIN